LRRARSGCLPRTAAIYGGGKPPSWRRPTDSNLINEHYNRASNLSAAEKRLPAINLMWIRLAEQSDQPPSVCSLTSSRTAPITTLSSATEPCRASSRVGAAAASVIEIPYFL
jgi:hypothetical protein